MMYVRYPPNLVVSWMPNSADDPCHLLLKVTGLENGRAVAQLTIYATAWSVTGL
jgi:hypothetical protein